MPKAELIRGDDIEIWETEVENSSTGERTTQKARFEDLISELNDNNETATVNIYRQQGNGRESMTFLDAVPADKYSVDELLILLRDQYGTGDYRLMVRSDGKLRANKLYSIEAPKKPAPEFTGNGGDNSALTTLIQQMMDRQERSEKMLLELARQTQQPNQQANKKEFLEEMMLYKQLFSTGSSSSGGLGQIQEALSFVRELGIEVGGQSEKEPGLGDLLEKANPLFQALLENKQNPQEPTDEQKAAALNKQKADSMKMAQNVMIKSGVGMLVNAAQNGSDPGNYAEMITTNFSREQISGFLLNEHSLETLKAINPGVGNYQQWFVDLRNHVRAVMGDRNSPFFSDWNDDELTPEGDDSIKKETSTGFETNVKHDIPTANDT